MTSAPRLLRDARHMRGQVLLKLALHPLQPIMLSQRLALQPRQHRRGALQQVFNRIHRIA